MRKGGNAKCDVGNFRHFFFGMSFDVPALILKSTVCFVCLFCYVLFCFVLFCFVFDFVFDFVFCFVFLFCFVLFCFVLFFRWLQILNWSKWILVCFSSNSFTLSIDHSRDRWIIDYDLTCKLKVYKINHIKEKSW